MSDESVREIDNGCAMHTSYVKQFYIFRNDDGTFRAVPKDATPMPSMGLLVTEDVELQRVLKQYSELNELLTFFSRTDIITLYKDMQHWKQEAQRLTSALDAYQTRLKILEGYE